MRIIRGRWLSEATAGDKPPALQNTNGPCNNRTTPNVNTLGKIRHSVYGQPQNQRHIIDEEKRSFSTTTLRSNISHRAKRDISRIPRGMPFTFCVSKIFHRKAKLFKTFLPITFLPLHAYALSANSSSVIASRRAGVMYGMRAS